MRILGLIAPLLACTLLTAPGARAQPSELRQVRVFVERHDYRVEAYAQFEPSAPPRWGELCTAPCATELGLGIYPLRARDVEGRTTKLPKLHLMDHVDARFQVKDLTRKRRRQRAVGIALGVVGLAFMVPSIAAASRCGLGSAAECRGDAEDFLVVGAAALAVGGVVLGLSFGPNERPEITFFGTR